MNDEETDCVKVKESNENSKKIPRSVKINYACICFLSFLTGADFAVIIPTLWERLHVDYQSSGSFMGLVMSSYSTFGVICGFIMGYLSDKIPETKPFYLIAMLFSISGHLLYFVGINKYFILLARILSGLCLGASTVALAYIARTTSQKQRTNVISIVMATRQLGLMLGPAFNIFLRKANYLLFNTFPIDKKSSPGLFMSSLWTLVFLTFLIFYKDKPSEKIKPNNKENEDIKFLSDNNETGKKIIKLTAEDYKREFFRIEIFVLLATTFFTYFNQTSIETIVIPFTEMMFAWTELENSILFCIGGGVIILSYFLIRITNIKFRDRTVLLTGVLAIFIGLVIGCTSLPFAKPIKDPSKIQLKIYKKIDFKDESLVDMLPNKVYNDSNVLLNKNNFENLSNNSNSSFQSISSNNNRFFPAFVVFVALDVLGLPAIAISSASLFTKLISNDVQGTGQGIQRGILGIGTIFGPLCAGPFVQMPIYILAITLVFIFIILILVSVSFRKLVPRISLNSK